MAVVIQPDRVDGFAPSKGLPAPPRLRVVLGRVGTSLVTAVLVPSALLWTGLVFYNLAIAVVGALVWLVAVILWRWGTHRPVSGLLVLTLAILSARTVLALVTGSPFLYFVQPVFADLLVAALFLGSLFTGRPVVARLAPDFYPMEPAVAARPGVRALFRGLTLMWGVVIVGKASITLTLLIALTAVDFVVVKGAAVALLTLVAVGVTVVWSIIVGGREGLLPRG